MSDNSQSGAEHPGRLPGEPASSLPDSSVERSALASADADPHSGPPGERPRFVFFGIVAAITLLLDIGSKAWAEIVLTARPAHEPSLLLVKDHLTLTLAYNKGGAWGLLQDS